jgi:SAM-dependent methyltransferase
VISAFNDSPDKTIVNLGSFPFAIDVALRDFYSLQASVISTVNAHPPADWASELTKRRIATVPVNLDPLVKLDSPCAGITDNLPMSDGSVELVLLAHVIEHLYHPQIILREAFRVLRPGGKIIVTTDNAFMLTSLYNMLSAAEYIHEPVQGTAAMVFHGWRGHVRFFSAGDLETMLTSIGFRVTSCKYYELLYGSFAEEYFTHPITSLPRWKADLLTALPTYRNEIMIVAER